MGRAKTDSGSSSRQQHDVHVYLNVYDLSEQNNVLYWCGFGVFHTGVEVFGYEYAYGGTSLALLDPSSTAELRRSRL